MLELPFPQMRYDITLPLLQGRVRIDGVTLVPGPASSMVTSADTPLRDGSFGLADLNLGYFLPAVEAGWELVGLPVFSKRKPVYGAIFCRRDAGIRTPRDLEGKRIGSRQYRTAITVWTRGLLQHRHGVDLSRLTWVVQAEETFPVHDPDVHLVWAEDRRRHMAEQLLSGEVDAIVTDISDAGIFARLEASDAVERLFPDYLREDARLYEETGVFTPVHLIVMSRRLDREHPDLAGRLFGAFEEAKRLAYEETLSDRGGFAVAYLREALRDQMARFGDLWRYGMAANRATIETFAAYNREQGMTRAVVRPEDAFAAGVLDT